jgi:hydroxymethylpyrimidine pyrophosphatase-like HAD family hydrolase
MDATGRRPGDPLLLACDLDGTLLDYEAAPLPGAGEAVAELSAAGALFVVVTGRPLQAARRATTDLSVEPVIFACYHGAFIVEASGAVIRHVPVPSGSARAVAAEALRRGAGVTVWDVDEPRELELGTGVGDEPWDAVSRLILHGDPVSMARLLSDLRAEWAGRLRIERIRSGFIGVFAHEVDKGEALGLVARRLGVPMERTVACGDGTADESLLAAAAVRVAVGGSPHVLGHLPGVVVTSWARLPDTLRGLVLPLL